MSYLGEFIPASMSDHEEPGRVYSGNLRGPRQRCHPIHDREFRDAVGVALMQGPQLDIGYLEKWAVELGVVEGLHELLRQLGEISSQ